MFIHFHQKDLAWFKSNSCPLMHCPPAAVRPYDCRLDQPRATARARTSHYWRKTTPGRCPPSAVSLPAVASTDDGLPVALSLTDDGSSPVPLSLRLDPILRLWRFRRSRGEVSRHLQLKEPAASRRWLRRPLQGGQTGPVAGFRRPADGPRRRPEGDHGRPGRTCGALAQGETDARAGVRAGLRAGVRAGGSKTIHPS